MKVEAVWEEALAHIEARVPRHVFDTWFIPLGFNGIYDSSVRLEVPNKFFGEWLTEHYGDLMSEAFAMATGRDMTDIAVTFVAGEKPVEKVAASVMQPGMRSAVTGRAPGPAPRRRSRPRPGSSPNRRTRPAGAAR